MPEPLSGPATPANLTTSGYVRPSGLFFCDPTEYDTMLIDRAIIHVKSGRGGDGHISFARFKYVPKGGPDGGDGGNGGDVILVAMAGVDTLLDLSGRHHWNAPVGEPGGIKQCHGRAGEDLEIRIPPGTLVYDDETGELIEDITTPGKRLLIAKGGRGGFGNEHFATPTDQAPRKFTRRASPANRAAAAARIETHRRRGRDRQAQRW